MGAEFNRKFARDFSAALRTGYKSISQEKLGGSPDSRPEPHQLEGSSALILPWVPYGELGDTFRYFPGS